MRLLLLAALLCTACGGGGSSTNGAANNPPVIPQQPQPSSVFTDYFPFLSGKSGSAVAVWRSTGAVLTTYTFRPFAATWGTATEHWALTTCNGEPWLTILGYQDGNGPIWQAESVRTTYDGVDLHCTTGAPYAPVALVPGVHVIRQWGRIAGDHEYFWASEFTFGQDELNPCWTGEQPNRPVIIQREVWQDRGGATVRGTIVGDPWVTEPQIIWDYRVAAGLGVGTLWHATSHEGEWCLSSIMFQ